MAYRHDLTQANNQSLTEIGSQVDTNKTNITNLQAQMPMGAAGNMNNVTVAASATSLVVTLNPAQPDTNYAINITPNWNAGSVWYTAKTASGFTINWSTAPVAAQALDWNARR